ncbi:MAG: hypothetical protein JNN22_16650, partial [Rhodospirillales bacterium]|nr:hypothetical protein [Rhodospirillales bacterium]
MAKTGLPAGIWEYRLIFFRESELVRAIGAFARLRKKPLPVGQITRLVLDSEELTLAVHLEKDDGGKVQRKFSGPEVAAALIAYCKDARIPLPRKAAKEMRVIANRPAFLIRERGPAQDGADQEIEMLRRKGAIPGV